MAVLSKFMAAFWLSRKTAMKVFWAKNCIGLPNLWLIRAKPQLRKKVATLNSSSWQNLLFKLLAITQKSHVKTHVNAKTTITARG